MADPLGDAFITIRPDLTQFQAQLQAQLRAISLLTTGITVPITPVVAAAGTAAAGLAAAAGPAAAATTALASAQAAAQAPALGLASAQTAVNAAMAQGAVVLGTTATATTAAAAAQQGAAGAMAATGAAATTAAKGTQGLLNQANLLRGAVIGISRVTPVAIFGLGIIGTAAVAASLAIRNAVLNAAKFEEQLNVFQVVAQATGDEMQRISDLSRQLGADIQLPGVSASDAAAAMTELAKAGLSVVDTVGAARGVLQLAGAAGIGAGEAAKITASALNSFALEGTQAVRIADLLAASSIAAQGEITDMAQALSQAGAVANNASISVDETVTAISLLAKNGLIGSDAGTSLRTTILRLVPTTKEAATFVRALGIEFSDAAGNLRPLPEIFQQYQEALAPLPETLRQAALQQIFGQDAIRAAAIFAREGAAGFKEMEDQVRRQGAAAEIAGAKAKGLSGAFSALTSNLQTFGTTTGSVALPALTELTRDLAELVSFAGQAADAMGRVSGVIGDIPVRTSIGETTVGTVLKEIALQANPVTGSIRRVSQAIKFFSGEEEDATKNTEEFLNTVTAISPALRDGFKILFDFGNALNDLKFGGGLDRENVAAATKGAVQAADESFKQLVTNFQGSIKLLGAIGVGSEAAAPFQDMVLQIEKELRKLGPKGEAAIQDLPPRLAAIFEEVKAQILAQADFEIPLRFQISANTAELSGDVNKQLADIEDRETFLEGKLGKAKPGSQRFKDIQDALIDVRNERESILASIKSEQDKAASDARAKAREIKTSADAADRAIIDELERGRTGTERKVTIAEGTPGDTDNVRALKNLEKRIQAEIDSVDERVKNIKIRNEQLEVLGDLLFNAVQARQAAEKRVQDAIKEAATTRANALTELLAKRITLADLQGNDTAELAAINKAIANARMRVNNWKKLGLVLIDEKIALQELINQKKELLKKEEEQKQVNLDLAAVFKEGQDILNRFAPNLQITGAGGLYGLFPGQRPPSLPPFPNGAVPPGVEIPGVGSGPGTRPQVELTAALDKNTAALLSVKEGIGTTINQELKFEKPTDDLLREARVFRFATLSAFDG